MGIDRGEELKGFTIIEVMLFLALSGFLLVGILAGTGSSIANQRYKDAVQDAADALRSAYSFVSDTQVEARDKNEGVCGSTLEPPSSISFSGNGGRGRTDCAVYGAVVTIYGSRIQTTTLVGRDYHDFLRMMSSKTAYDNATDEEKAVVDNTSIDDMTLLSTLKANNLAYQCGSDITKCTPIVAGGARTQKLKWDTIFKAPNTDGEDKNRDLSITLLIYRSPVTGAIRTVVMEKEAISDGGKVIDYNEPIIDPKRQGVHKYLSGNNFVQKDLYFCVDSNGADSYADHNRIIKIVKNAHSQTGIVLTDMDEDIRDEEGNEVTCDK